MPRKSHFGEMSSGVQTGIVIFIVAIVIGVLVYFFMIKKDDSEGDSTAAEGSEVERLAIETEVARLTKEAEVAKEAVSTPVKLSYTYQGLGVPNGNLIKFSLKGEELFLPNEPTKAIDNTDPIFLVWVTRLYNIITTTPSYKDATYFCIFLDGSYRIYNGINKIIPFWTFFKPIPKVYSYSIP